MNKQSVVMIVDDDDSVRRAARRLIRSFGFAVDTFASAEDFLACGRLDETACLVLDLLHARSERSRIAGSAECDGIPPSYRLHHRLRRRQRTDARNLRLARMPTSSNPS